MMRVCSRVTEMMIVMMTPKALLATSTTTIYIYLMQRETSSMATLTRSLLRWPLCPDN